MHAPQWLCQKLYREFPDLRIGWAGRDKRDEKDENPGVFALIQLYPQRVIGSLDEPSIIEELWPVTMRPDAHGKPTMVKIDRGPIFNRHGGTRPDWDVLSWIPVFKDVLPPVALFSGQLLQKLHRGSMRPMIEKSAAAASRELLRKTDDLTRQGYEKLKREANKPDAAHVTVPWEFAKADVERFYKRKEKQRAALENYYNPYKRF